MHPVSLFIGGIAALPGSGRPTGMFKRPLTAPLQLGPEGFAGDEQADRRVHGGPEKAVHLYPTAHYARLAAAFPEAAGVLVPGSLGENISCAALDEASVRVGATFALGTARLQVCQPRNPCWKIDDRFAADGMAAFIAEHGLTGWYFRVLHPGTVTPGDMLACIDAAPGAPTLAAAAALWRKHRPPVAALRRLANCPGIASGWRDKVTARADWLAGASAVEAPPPPSFHVKPEAP
jgi:MOSC domain-containing protein YiiM